MGAYYYINREDSYYRLSLYPQVAILIVNVTKEVKMEINIGIDDNNRKAVADDLAKLLADSYTLYLKTQNFHWNVTGPHFTSLHLLFEQQYTELAMAVDEIAERIRALGHIAPGGFKRYNELASLTDSPETLSAQEMIETLVRDNETIIKNLNSYFAKAEEAKDQPSLDLLTKRLELHEKSAWMLRSLIA